MKFCKGGKVSLSLSRPPHGGRGLKSCAPCAPVSPFASPPARGAWIEIGAIILYSSSRYVAPRTGGVD